LGRFVLPSVCLLFAVLACGLLFLLRFTLFTSISLRLRLTLLCLRLTRSDFNHLTFVATFVAAVSLLLPYLCLGIRLASALGEWLEKTQIPASSGQGVVKIIGTSPQSIDEAEDRDRWTKLLNKLDIRQPAGGMVSNKQQVRPQ
jgi:hypothetical protein